MAVETVRSYRVEDTLVEAKTRYVIEKLSTYLGDFKELDSSIFDDTFVLELQNKLNEVCDICSDRVYMYSQAAETAKVMNLVVECGDFARSCKWFIKKVAKKQASFMPKFAYSKLDTATRSPIKMIAFMDTFSTQLFKYAELLKEEGIAHEKFDEATTVIEQLKLQREKQLDAIALRTEMGEKRIQMYNSIWANLATLADASTYIFPKGSRERDMFALPSLERNSSPYSAS